MTDQERNEAEMLESVLPLLKWLAAKYCDQPYETFDDLVQIGALRTVKLIRTWDPDRGTFATYVRMFAGQAMRTAINPLSTVGNHRSQLLGIGKSIPDDYEWYQRLPRQSPFRERNATSKNSKQVKSNSE